ncbi:MAG: DUF2811 domain-containing protein [Phormidesmis sp.]
MFLNLLGELPSEITQHLQLFIEQRPDWTQERIMCSALALFLLQNGVRDRAVSQVYLRAMFPEYLLEKGGAS